MCQYRNFWCFLPLSGIFRISIVVQATYECYFREFVYFLHYWKYFGICVIIWPTYEYVMIRILVLFVILERIFFHHFREKFHIHVVVWATNVCANIWDFVIFGHYWEYLGIWFVVWVKYEYAITRILLFPAIVRSILNLHCCLDNKCMSQYRKVCFFLPLVGVSRDMCCCLGNIWICI